MSKLSFAKSGNHCRSDPVRVQSTASVSNPENFYLCEKIEGSLFGGNAESRKSVRKIIDDKFFTGAEKHDLDRKSVRKDTI